MGKKRMKMERKVYKRGVGRKNGLRHRDYGSVVQ